MDVPWSGRRLHFVGIGGAGMSGLALVAQALGADVSGSDRSVTGSTAQRLREAGIEPRDGHDATHVPADAEVVYSTAIAAENPERTTGAAELHRAALLGELTRLKPTIAVSGTHGKTTTSSMLVHALTAIGADPSYLVGGEVRSTGTNAAWGAGEWLVVEADESDRSLLELHPRIAVVTNAELDHETTYSSLRDVLDTFRRFVARADHAVVWDRPELRALCTATPGTVYDVPEPRLDARGSRFEVGGHAVVLTVPGAHNALNAAAALTAIAVAGLDVAGAATGLESFTGAGRRFERLGRTAGGADVVDDYAHHPTEVAATLAASRTLDPRRVVAVFQPHLFSRTRRHARAFGQALAAADEIVVTGIYAARERQEDFPGVTGRLIAAAAADHAGGRPVAWLPDLAEAERHLRATLRAGDLCLTMGAGDVDALGRALVEVGDPAPAPNTDP